MFNLRGFPGYIKIMQRRKFRLNISARSHFACACENNTLCAGAELRIHFVALFLRRRIAGGANLVFGNAAPCKLLLEVIVHGEFPVMSNNTERWNINMRKSKRLLQSLACCAVVLTMCTAPLTTAAFAASAATVTQEDGSSNDDETAAYTFIVMVNDTAAVRPGSGTAVYPGNPNASDIRLTITIPRHIMWCVGVFFTVCCTQLVLTPQKRPQICLYMPHFCGRKVICHLRGNAPYKSVYEQIGA